MTCDKQPNYKRVLTIDTEKREIFKINTPEVKYHFLYTRFSKYQHLQLYKCSIHWLTFEIPYSNDTVYFGTRNRV
jgi:hypothetical protein